MKVYAFDVDETLDISGGPVSMSRVRDLTREGHIVGICGNWAVACRIPGWHTLWSFVGPAHNPCPDCGRGWAKSDFLGQLKTYIPADDYVMVGNDPRYFGASADEEAARLAGWRFIRDDDFAKGER